MFSLSKANKFIAASLGVAVVLGLLAAGVTSLPSDVDVDADLSGTASDTSGMYVINGTIKNATTDSTWTLSNAYVVTDGHMGVQPAPTLGPGETTTFSSYSNNPLSGDDTQITYVDQYSNGFTFEAQNLPGGHNIDGTGTTSTSYAINGSISSGYHETATFTAVGSSQVRQAE